MGVRSIKESQKCIISFLCCRLNLYSPVSGDISTVKSVVVFIVFGCFLDVFALIVLFVPLFYPTVMALGFDSVWFGTMSVMLVNIALITPPIAGNIYIAQALEPGTPVGDVIKGVLPFYAASILLVVLLVFFPIIAMWLPNMMIGA